MNQFINGINADGRDEISEEVFLTFANFRGYTRPAGALFLESENHSLVARLLTSIQLSHERFQSFRTKIF